MKNKGIILAGGLGTRLRPLTYITNKHLLPVYNLPMIDYPINTLKAMGCTEIIIITGGNNIGDFAEYLENGNKYDVKFTYRVQNEAGGIAQALLEAEGLVDGLFPVILGDNYFNLAPESTNKPTIYLKEVDNPQRFGVYDNKTNSIVEKPENPISNLAVTGLYVYDNAVFDFIKELKPSGRNELEITDVNNWYLSNNNMKVKEYKDFWSDMGTFESLYEVTSIVRSNK